MGQISNNPRDEIIHRYESENGNVLNTDSVKEMFRDEGYDPTCEQSVREYHPRAAKLTGQFFAQWLECSHRFADGFGCPGL